VRQQIIADVDDGFFDHIHLGTPCDTYSQLRENQPGPRPLSNDIFVKGKRISERWTKVLSTGSGRRIPSGTRGTGFAQSFHGGIVSAERKPSLGRAEFADDPDGKPS